MPMLQLLIRYRDIREMMPILPDAGEAVAADYCKECKAGVLSKAAIAAVDAAFLGAAEVAKAKVVQGYNFSPASQ
jgi:plasmid replication initiation protein